MFRKKRPHHLSLTSLIFIGLVLGLFVGLVFKDIHFYLEPVGNIFLRLIQMSIVILVLGQIVEAVSQLDVKSLGRTGIKTVLIFSTSSLLAAFWGMAFGIIFKIGQGLNISQDMTDIKINDAASFGETLINFFPNNIFNSLSEGSIVQIIVFGIFFGIALSMVSIDEDNFILVNMIELFNKVIMKLIKIVMYFSPIGVFALVSSSISKYGIKVIIPLLKYLVIYGFVTALFLLLWGVVVSAICKVSIVTLFRKLTKVSNIALATTSSAIALPIALEDTQKKLGVSERISSFVLPLGMPLNSNGSAMHMAITVITIAQIFGINYSIDRLIYLVVLCTLASLANAVVPGASLVSLSIIVPQLGLPVESIALFMGIDYFVGMLRTILNVNSDIFTAMIVAKSENELDNAILNG